MIVGNATENANNQAFNQMLIRLGTKPILKMVMTNDMMQNISNAIKKEKKSGDVCDQSYKTRLGPYLLISCRREQMCLDRYLQDFSL